nr:MAG TPA: hypothetical protein [Caudoviricetes sp.]
MQITSTRLQRSLWLQEYFNPHIYANYISKNT